jgi:predicted MFS family arabinose efflux permease
MRKRLDDIARAGVHAVGVFFATIIGGIRGWVEGTDLSVIAVLAVVALILLFLLVPNRRRY